MSPVNNKLDDTEIFEMFLPRIDEIPNLLQQLINDRFGSNLSPFHASWKSNCEARIPKVVAWLRTAPPQTASQVADQILRPAPTIIRDKTRRILEQHFAKKNIEISSAVKSALEQYSFEQIPFDANQTLNDFAQSIAKELLTPPPLDLLKIKVRQLLAERFSEEGGIPSKVIEVLHSYRSNAAPIDTSETFDNQALRTANYIIWKAQR